MEPVGDLQVALVQTDLFWENSIANLASLEEKLALLTDPVDVIVLPEMFSTGFTMNVRSQAEPMNHTTTRWMKQVSAKTNALLIGSVSVKDGEHYFNRAVCFRPDGSYEYYDKRHLFRMGREHETYTAGVKRILIEWKGRNICPLICHDLRLLVWSRPAAATRYAHLIDVANWPARRSTAWRILLQARAIENQSFTIGVNRIGTDGKGIVHEGGSLAVDFQGKLIADLADQDIVSVVSLSASSLFAYRNDFPAYLDADSFQIIQ